MKSFSAPGIWYLPETDAHPVAGTLEFSPDSGILLSLTGTLNDSAVTSEIAAYPTIHGIVDECPYGRHITLVDAFRKSWSLRMPGFATERIFSNRGFAGNVFLSPDQLTFSGATVAFDCLFDWVGTSGLARNLLFDSERNVIGVEVRYERPTPLIVPIDDATVSFQSSWEMPKSRRNDVTIRQDTSIGVTTSGGFSDELILSRFVSPLQDFVTLGIDGPCAIERLILRHSTLLAPGTNHPAEFDVLFQPVYRESKSEASRTPDEMLFGMNDIRPYIGSMLRRWMGLSPRLDVARNIFLGSQHSPGRYIDEKFILLTQAMILFFDDLGEPGTAQMRPSLEATARSLSTGTGVEWLYLTLPTDAEIQFPYRLLDAIRKYGDITGSLAGADAERFVSSVVATRAYLIHRPRDQADGVLSGVNLYWTIHKLRLIQSICILDYLGMPVDAIAGCIRRNAGYLHIARTVSPGERPL